MANTSGKRPNNKKANMPAPRRDPYSRWKVGARMPEVNWQRYEMGQAYQASAAAQASRRPSGPTTRSGKPKPPPSRTASGPAGRGGRATGGPMTATDAMRAGRNRGKKPSGPAGRGKQVSGKTSGMGPKKVAPPRRTAGGTYR